VRVFKLNVVVYVFPVTGGGDPLKVQSQNARLGSGKSPGGAGKGVGVST